MIQELHKAPRKGYETPDIGLPELSIPNPIWFLLLLPQEYKHLQALQA